uniref:BY PROTMAP: gi/342319415/gb/EGU11364.1/ Thiosulfate sulfurtransferase [Rhodotorula glutinis ATCC 204091] n=1 Tax=Rhodotorula toruloides TaxID=5286 RepID=A0A0K3CNI7_RHOTO
MDQCWEEAQRFTRALVNGAAAVKHQRDVDKGIWQNADNQQQHELGCDPRISRRVAARYFGLTPAHLVHRIAPRLSLITPGELHKLLSSKNEEGISCVLNASWHMPGSGRQPFQEYRKKRIEGAAFWDVTSIILRSLFSTAVFRAGLPRATQLTRIDLQTRTRTPSRKAAASSTDPSSPSSSTPTSHKSSRTSSPTIEENFSEYKVDGGKKSDVQQCKDMTKNIKKGEKGDVIVDARQLGGAFHGTDPEPREGLSSGHMPHSISLPFQSVLLPELSTTPPYRTLLKPDELEKVFVEVLGEEKWEKVKQGEKSVTATCGSGMTQSASFYEPIGACKCRGVETTKASDFVLKASRPLLLVLLPPARDPPLRLPHLVIANSRCRLRLFIRQLIPRHLKMASEPLKGELGCWVIVLERQGERVKGESSGLAGCGGRVER